MTGHDPHLCTKCYEVNKGYEEDSDEVKTCDECGGKVLTLQEAADYIAELKEQLRHTEVCDR